MCMFMAMTTLNMDSPHGKPKTLAWVQAEGDWYALNGTMVPECGCRQMALPNGVSKNGDELFMAFEPPFNRGGDAEKCIQHQGAAGMSVLCMILFSLCVQAAEGLHYGIVPYVSRPALGIVSGMVGAGSNLGSVIALSAFFKGKDIRTDEGFLKLGIMVIGLTALMFFIY